MVAWSPGPHAVVCTPVPADRGSRQPAGSDEYDGSTSTRAREDKQGEAALRGQGINGVLQRRSIYGAASVRDRTSYSSSRAAALYSASPLPTLMQLTETKL